MSKITIAIVSVLKPVNDSRNFEKTGLSISQTNKYTVNIIGFWTKNIPEVKNINLHPLFNFNRTHPVRLWASWNIYNKLLQLKPEVIIATTHESLFVICLYKIIFGAKILYDIQENYYRNIRFTSTYPPLLRTFLAMYVRGKEKLCNRWIDHYSLAEQSYSRDLKFTTGKSTIIENKTTLEPHEKVEKIYSSRIQFTYTGTISDNYGIFDAIAFIDRMHQINSHVHFVIAGYCAKKSTWKKVLRKTKGKDYITIRGGDHLLSHNQIIKAIEAADFVLLPYQLDRSIVRCIPTKIYECITLKTPMIIRPNPLWLKLCNQFNASMPCDFKDEDEHFLRLILNRKYYTKGNVEVCSWENEKIKLLKVIERLTQ